MRKSDNIADKQQLDNIICITLEVLRLSGIILCPIIPGLCEKLLNKLNVDVNSRNWNDLYNFVWKNGRSTNISLNSTLDAVLFRRIQIENADKSDDTIVKSKSRSKTKNIKN